MTSNRLPSELDNNQWVIWRNVHGKKIPHVADDLGYTRASSINPTSWRSYKQAKEMSCGAQGIGYVFTAEDGIIGIDIDHCVKDRKINAEALAICRELKGYTEFSPSGEGVHILVRGSLGDLKGLNSNGVEIYDRRRYFTVTEDVIYCPPELPDCTDRVLSLYERYKQPVEPQEQVPPGQRNDTLMRVAGSLRQAGVPLPAAKSVLHTLNQTWCADGGIAEPEVDSMLARYMNLQGPDLEAVPVQLSTMSEIQEFYGKLEWTWEDRIPKGYLTMIAGPQAVGKSYFAADLAARISSGARWPDGQPGHKPAKVLIIETEEMRGAWVDRLAQAGAKPENICFLGGVTELVDIDERFPSIVATCREWNPKAIIVDSLSGGHGRKENDANMRKLLKKYAELAGTLSIPILLVHHTRKRTPEESTEVTLDRIRGSNTITQFCRSVVVLYRYEDTGRTKADWVKSTFCEMPTPLGFTITGAGLQFGEAPVAPKKPTAVDDAVEFVEELLQDGEVLSSDVYDEGEAAGFSQSALKRAKRRLGVGKLRKDGHWYWIAAPELEFHVPGLGGMGNE